MVSELSVSSGMRTAHPNGLAMLFVLSGTLGRVIALSGIAGIAGMVTALSYSRGMVTGVTDALGMIIGLSQTMGGEAGYSYSRNWDVGQDEAEHTSSNIMGMIPVLDIVMGSRNPCDTRTHTCVTHAGSKDLLNWSLRALRYSILECARYGIQDLNCA